MSEWTGKRVLVTGAGGFIGSHLTEALARDGATVRAFVRYNSRGDAGLLRQLPADVLSELDVIAGDLRDGAAVTRAVAGCDVVFHLGAIISIPYSYQHPLETAETNFMGTLAVLLACREHGVGRLVQATRCKGSRPTRPARSAPTNWWRASTARMTCRPSPCDRSIPMVRANRPAPSSRPSSPRR